MSWRAGLAVIGLAVVCACSGAGPLAVRKVLVDVDPGAAAGAGGKLDREQLRKVINDVLKETRGVRMVDAKEEGSVMRVRIEGYAPELGDSGGEQDPPQTLLRLSVEVTGDARANAAAGDSYRAHATAVGGVDVDARALVGQALRDALVQVLMTKKAGGMPSEKLVAWLDGDRATSDQKRRAMGILASRGDSTAVEALTRVLAGSEQELQPHALAALTTLHDPRAVDAIVAYSDRKPPAVVKHCIAAVRAMGGQGAKAWLFTLSTGHSYLEVQQHATAALASLEATSAAGGLADAAPVAVPAEATR